MVRSAHSGSKTRVNALMDASRTMKARPPRPSRRGFAAPQDEAVEGGFPVHKPHATTPRMAALIRSGISIIGISGPAFA
jgi:hypothetical protein